MTLHDLALKYGSDKAEHGYCPFYEQYLPKNPKKLLEIGVLQGASIRMWKEYFPECEIHGLDLFIDNPIPDIHNVVWHKGNQIDYLLLEQLRKENFDIVVDDGSHNSRDQMMTFFGLFNGNQYYIEDLQCCYEEFYRQRLPYAATALDLFNSIHDSGSNLETVTGKNITLIYAP
jgi:hypothetical protein